MRTWTRALALSALVGAVGCDIQAPEVPTYETSLTIPLSEQRKSMAELVDDLDGIVISDDDIRLDISGELDAITLDDEMSISASGTTFSTEVGTFDLPEDIGGTVAFTVDDLVSGFPTGTVIVPPFAFNAPERELSGITELTSVALETGMLVVDLTNDLPVPVSGSCALPGLTMTVRESLGGSIIAALTYEPEVGPGETIQMSADLAGMSLTSTMSVEITGCSPGSGGQPVDVAEDDGFALSLGLVDVTASSATAELPAQSFSTMGTSSWGDDMLLQEAVILSGGTTIEFQNDTPLAATIEMRFPAFIQDGGPLTITLPLPGMGSDTATIDFSSVSFISATATNELEYEVDVTTPGSGGVQVTLSSTDAINVVVGDLSLELDWLVGVPEAIEETFGPFTESVEWPDDTDAVQPADASFAIQISSELGVNVAGTLTILASNNSGETASLTQGITILPGAIGAPVMTTIVFDSSNSTIVDVLAILPTEMTISGALEVGDGVSTVRIDRGANVDGSYTVSAPFAFTVTGGTIDLDPILLDIGAETRQRILEDVSRVELVANLLNGFPFGATATLMFSPNEADVYTSPSVILDPVVAPPAEINPLSGKAETASEADNVIELAESELSIFENETIYLGVRIELAPSDGVVVITASNEVVVSSYAVVDLTVSSNLFEGDE